MLVVVKCFITTWVRKPGGAPDVRSGSRRASALSLSGATSRAATEEASKVASSLQVTSQFKDHLFGRNCVAEDLLAIAQPVSIDWEEVILYEAFTLSLEDEKVLIAKFPRVDGWLIDDFTPAVLALIELAEVILDCDRLLVCIDRGAAELNCVVRSLLYVGFRVIEQFPVNSAHVSKYFLLSYETE